MKKAILGLLLTILILIMGIPVWVLRDYAGFPDKPSTDSPPVRVLNRQTGKIMKLPLEEYLVGVVAAEMPAKFDLEALKAQAVAARTYTARRMFTYGAKPSDIHGQAEICTNPVHCQAWCDTAQLRSRWGRLRYYLYLNKIKKAVRLTRGQVITHNSALIEPVYHGSCGGKGTENSEEVWSGEIPYLRGVTCDEEYRVQEHVYNFEVSRSELSALMGNYGLKPATAPDSASPAVYAVRKSPRGRLQEIRLMGQPLTGAEFRRMLGLTSTMIRWNDDGSRIKFTSIGKGHAVGLCQYGANGMALAGKDYRTIICHYYTEVKVQILKY